MKLTRLNQLLRTMSALAIVALAARGQELDPLPEGTVGIASKYPADAGIEANAAVVFAHNFERDERTEDLRHTWDVVFHDETIQITDAPQHVHAGRKALQLTFPQRPGEVGNGLMKKLARQTDILFLRFYQKFDGELDVTGAASFHNGGTIAARYYADGRSSPGRRADGRNKFMVGLESTVYSNAPAPGHLTVYIYHPEQRHDYGDIFFPTGVVQPNSSLPGNFGPHVQPRANLLPELGTWTCYELMVKANTPGARDGRVAFWVDGKLIADFPNLRLRDLEDLKIDFFSIGGYINPNPVRTNMLWYDDVVAATSYIGPQHPREPQNDAPGRRLPRLHSRKYLLRQPEKKP